MAGLSVTFKAVDQISSRFENMVSSGNRALNAFDNIGNAAETAYSTIAESVDETAGIINIATQATDSWTDAIENYERETAQATDVAEAFAESGSMTEEALSDAAQSAVEASEQLGEAAEQMQESTEQMEEFGDESERAGEESERFGDRSTEAMNSLDNILTSAGIAVALNAIGNAFEECSEAAAEFETNVAMVSTVANATVLSTDQLSSQISELSENTAKSVNDLADSTYNAISAGIDTANAVDTVGIATKLSEAGFTSVTSALSVLTTALNAYHLEATELTNVSDSLVVAQNLGVLTIDQLSSSMGKAISTASAYSVDLYNLESGYVSITKAGISVEESTTYISAMFNELGSSGSAVAKILQEETGMSFGQLMQSGSTLADTLEILYNSANRDSEALMNLWGSAEAGKASNAIIGQGLDTFNQNLEKLENSAGTTEKAYEKMTNTTEFSTKRMDNSFQNLSIAIGSDLNPVVAVLKNGIADLTDEFTELINEHPAIVAAVTGAAVAFGVFAAAVSAFALVTTPMVVTAFKTITAAMMANPIFLAITAVVALTAAVAAFVTVLASQETEYESWTASTRAQSDELENLNQEYEQACEKYGETSKEASKLKYELDELNAEFEANKQTVEEFVAECDALAESHDKLIQSYDENMSSIKENELGTVALIQKLENLALANDKTVDSEEQMRAIIEKLNADLPDLALSYDDVTQSVEATVEAMRKAAEQQAEDERKAEQQRTYVDLLKEQAILEEKIGEAEANLNAERKDKGMHFDEELNDGAGAWTNGIYTEDSKISAWTSDLDEYNKVLNELNSSYKENQDEIAGIEDAWEGVALKAQDATESMSDAEMAEAAITGVQDRLTELCTAYDNAYASARGSIDGQIGLFDKMRTESEQSVADMQAAFDSQIEYLNTYTENLQKAADYGVNESLVSSLSDGSAESAGQLDAIIGKIEELGGTTAGMSQDAQEFVDSFNSSFTQVQTAKDTFAETVAEMESDFSEKMNEINTDLLNTVGNMNKAEEAADAAKATMNAYINAIKAKIPEVNSALAALDFAGKGLPFSVGDTKPKPVEHADGGIFDTPHYGVFAEAGPEAFIPIDGSKNAVDIWENTGNMLGMYPSEKESASFYVAPREMGTKEETSAVNKTITLKVEGSGDMRISSGMDKESIVNILAENMKGVLMNIVKQEILEEGEMAYDF